MVGSRGRGGGCGGGRGGGRGGGGYQQTEKYLILNLGESTRENNNFQSLIRKLLF